MTLMRNGSWTAAERLRNGAGSGGDGLHTDFRATPGTSATPVHAGPELSVVIPVYNEEANLPALCARLYAVLDDLRRPYEIVFTNDGSGDRSFELLRAQYESRPDVTRVIDLETNHGQHTAIMAAFECARGDVVITLDADLQNPPEEIPKLLAAIDAGHDYVGGVRVDREDPAFRIVASWIINAVRQRMTNIEMTDHGCMLRAYRRTVVEAMVRSGALNTFIPALAYTFASRPTEVQVRHSARHAGVSSYSLPRLIRLNFDLITSCSIAPLQFFTLFALACAAGSFVLMLVLGARWIFLAPEGALHALLGMLLFLVTMTMVRIELTGGYAGRTCRVVSARPRYQVREVLEAKR